MSVRSAVAFRETDIPVGEQNLEQVLTIGDDAGGLSIVNLQSINGISSITAPNIKDVLISGNDAQGSSLIGLNNLEVQTINGFSTNRNTQGEFITNTTITATANVDFTIPIVTPISLYEGTYIANIKINLSGTASIPTSYIIYLYLDDGVTDDLLTSSFISSASAINGVSLTIPSFPVAVATDFSVLTLRGRVNVNSSVLVSGFGDSYINCGLVFAGSVTPPNPPPLPSSWVFKSQTIGGLTTSSWVAPSISTDGSTFYLANNSYSPYSSLDKGLTWNQLLPNPVSIIGWNVSATIADGTIAYYGETTEGDIYKYDGASFVFTESIGAEITQIVTTPSGNNSALVIRGVPTSRFYTSGSPINFAETAVPNAPSGIIWSGVNISSTGGISYLLCSTNNNSIYYKNTAGVWSSSTPNSGETYTSITSTADFGVIYVVSFYSKVYKSTDQGTSWTLIKDFGYSTSGPIILSCNANDGSKVVCAIPNSFLSISNDGGANWDNNVIGSFQYQGWSGASFSGDGTNLLLTAKNGVSLVGTYS
jgi:hypothetical protein